MDSAAPKRYVILGNGIAGTTAADTLRRLDRQCRITVIGNEPYPLYNRVALPRVLQGRMPPEKTVMRTLAWHRERGIELLLETHAQAVLPKEREVHLSDGRALPFDSLLVATGGTPRPLPCPGGDARHVYNFQTLDDTKEILAQVPKATRAAVVGGSFISYELTEGFVAQGLHVTWLIRGPRFLHRVLDEEGGKLVHSIAADRGVDVRTETQVREIQAPGGEVRGVVTTTDDRLAADLVGVGVGLALNTHLLAGTGAEIRNGIVTDEYLATSLPGIFAAGDVAEFYDVIVKRHHTLGTWDNALMHGRVAAENMAGGHTVYREVPTYSSTLFDSNISVLGATPEDRSDLASIQEVDHRQRVYRKLFFHEDRLVGAVFIGTVKGRKKVLDLIQKGSPLDEAERAALMANLS